MANKNFHEHHQNSKKRLIKLNKIKAKELAQTQKNSKKRLIKLNKIKAKELAQAQKNKHRIEKHNKYAQNNSLRKNQFIKGKISNIRNKYNQKIKFVKNKLSSLATLGIDSKQEELKFQESLINKYYSFHIKRISQKYDRKINKVKHNQKIAKITNEEAEILLNNMEIDRHLNLEFYSHKLNFFKNKSISSKHLTIKIELLERQKQCEIEALATRNKLVPAVNVITELKDTWENLKSFYVFGYEIRGILQSISTHLRRYSMVYIFFFVIFTFFITTNGSNIKPDQFINILYSNTYILIIGLAMLMVIVSGNIDLSVGALMGFLGAFSVLMYNRIGNLFAAMILTMLVGALTGLVQGICIGYFKMPSFIVTLGGMLLFKGLILWLTASTTLIPFAASYSNFVLGIMPDVRVGDLHLFSFLIIFTLGIMTSIIMFIGRRKKSKYGIVNDSTLSFLVKLGFIILIFTAVAYLVGFSIFGLKYYILYIMLLIVIFVFVMQNTSFGRKIYAVGGNSKAAILSGINKARITTYVFIIIGVMVGFASIVYTGINTSASSAVSSNGYELDVISSVFVGGASMTGGIGTIQGTVIGGLILGYINNGMNLMNLGADMQNIIKAVVLVSAVGYDIFSNRKIG